MQLIVESISSDYPAVFIKEGANFADWYSLCYTVRNSAFLAEKDGVVIGSYDALLSTALSVIIRTGNKYRFLRCRSRPGHANPLKVSEIIPAADNKSPADARVKERIHDEEAMGTEGPCAGYAPGNHRKPFGKS